LIEKRGHAPAKVGEVLNSMFNNINRELSWKVYIEAAQSYERLGGEHHSRTFEYMMQAVMNSPENLKWKVWLIASRSEYKIGNSQ
jgi:pilus assembly protein TadC